MFTPPRYNCTYPTLEVRRLHVLAPVNERVAMFRLLNSQS